MRDKILEIIKSENRKLNPKEILDLKVTDIKLEFIQKQTREPNLKELAIKLEEDTDTISSVSTQAQIASIENIDFSTVTSIYVKVVAYPGYEFEIKQDLEVNDPAQVTATKEEELRAAQALLEEKEAQINQQATRISDLEQQLLNKQDYINPAGEEEINITTNGTITRDIREKASVKINTNVPIPTGYLKPTGTLNITTNGEHNVKDYEKVNVQLNDALLNNLTLVNDLTEYTNGRVTTISKSFNIEPNQEYYLIGHYMFTGAGKTRLILCTYIY